MKRLLFGAGIAALVLLSGCTTPVRIKTTGSNGSVQELEVRDSSGKVIEVGSSTKEKIDKLVPVIEKEIVSTLKSRVSQGGFKEKYEINCGKVISSASMDPLTQEETALFTAVKRNQLQVANFLLAMFGDDKARKEYVEIKNTAGLTAFGYACTVNAHMLLDTLAQAGAEFNEEDLANAAVNNCVGAAQWLVEQGLDVNDPKVTFAWFGSANLTGAGMGAKSDRKRNFENGIVTDDSALIAPLEDQFDAVWRGDFCKDCGCKDFCGDPVKED